MKRIFVFVAAAGVFAWAGRLFGAEAGPAVEVAPNVEKSRQQIWASAAWNEGAKAWLVAWREGFLNEPEVGCEIWCARVSAEGKAMDPAGVRLAGGKGLKDKPKVASDGKRWLVVWEDLRNGKDWDVYGSVVSAEGRPAVAEGVLVAGGERNQCRPVICFVGGVYIVVWMGFKGEGYEIFAGRVSADGKALDGGGIQVSKQLKVGARVSNGHIYPAVAACGNRAVVTWMPISYNYGGTSLAVGSVDAEGKVEAASVFGGGDAKSVGGEPAHGPAIAGSGEGVLIIGNNSWGEKMFVVARATKEGQPEGGLVPSYGVRGANNFVPNFAIAFGGGRYLMVSDYVRMPGKGETADPRVHIRGWELGLDGKVGDANGFEVAFDKSRDLLVPSVAGGAGGTFLVVYSEMRGVDAVKLMCRVVGAGKW